MTAARFQQGDRQHVGLKGPSAVAEHLAEELGPALRGGQGRHRRRQPGQRLGGVPLPLAQRQQLGVGLLQLLGAREEIGLGLVHPLGPLLRARVRPAVVAVPDVVGDVVRAVQQEDDVVGRVEDRHGAVAPEALDPAAVGQPDVVPLQQDGVGASGVTSTLEGLPETGRPLGARVLGIGGENVEQTRPTLASRVVAVVSRRARLTSTTVRSGVSSTSGAGVRWKTCR